MSENMGAEHRYDLTSDVTHLIIGNIDTAKYQYVARERPDVKVLLPSFVEAVRDSWKAGEDADVAALERQHRVPTYYGLKICLTGFDDLDRRQELTKYIEDNGGEYHGDLTKQVTHLVAAVPGGKKYEYALKWGLKVVSEKWLFECHERGMVLKESLYDPQLVPDEQGRDAWNRAALQTMLGKRQRDNDEPKPASTSSKRKLRRTMSAKLGGNHTAMWADIAGASAATTQDGKEGERDTDENARSKILPAAFDYSEEPEPTEQMSTAATVVQVPSAPSPRPSTIFQGAAVCIRGFSGQKLDVVQRHLVSNGAHLITESDEAQASNDDQGYLIVPHDAPSDYIPTLPATMARFEKVTEWWLESCVHSKRLVDPKSDWFCRPFPRLKVDGKSSIPAADEDRLLNYNRFQRSRCVLYKLQRHQPPPFFASNTTYGCHIRRIVEERVCLSFGLQLFDAIR